MDPQTFLTKQILFPTRVFGHVKRDHSIRLDPSVDAVSAPAHSISIGQQHWLQSSTVRSSAQYLFSYFHFTGLNTALHGY